MFFWYGLIVIIYVAYARDGEDWTQIGVVGDIENLVNTYSPREYEFGVQYNQALGQIQSVIINSWNKGIRISSVNDYPMGDDSKTLKYGKTVFTKGLNNNPTTTSFYHFYYYMEGNQQFHSNGVADAVRLYARRVNAWIEVGTLSDIESLVDEYSLSKYEYGIQYNSALGAIHKLHLNSWNRGTRIETYDSYPTGDDSLALKFGRAIFTKGLDNNPDATNWYHQYYYLEGNQAFHSNGNSNTRKIFVRELENEYVSIGIMDDLQSLMQSTYPPESYKIAVKYNAGLGEQLDDVIINSWNKGARVSTVVDYPMGDDSLTLKFGKAVLTQGLNSNPTTSDWFHYYYYMQNNEQFHSNGNSDTRQIYAQKQNDWIQVGTLSDIETSVETHPLTAYEYGIKYNAGFGLAIHKITANTWNRGIRIETYNSYPMGDDSKTLRFGRAVFTKGNVNNPDTTNWYHYYYVLEGNAMIWSNGNSNNRLLYRRRLGCDEESYSGSLLSDAKVNPFDEIDFNDNNEYGAYGWDYNNYWFYDNSKTVFMVLVFLCFINILWCFVSFYKKRQNKNKAYGTIQYDETEQEI